MRVCKLLALVPALLSAAELRIDHATVAGAELKKLQANLQAVGIPSVYGGPHSNNTSEMALVSFPDGSYLELMALQPGADPRAVEQHEWSKFLKGNAGPCAWAACVKDIAAEVKRLQSAHVAVSEPAKSGRQRPDGVHLEWQTSNIGPGIRGTFFPFLIEDLTPREQRVYPSGKPVSRDFRGVSRVVIAVRSLDEAIKRYQQAFEVPPPIKQVDKGFEAQLALLGGVPVILAQPLTPDSWLHARLEQFGEAPCAFILAATRPGRYKASSKARWFGIDVSWFDPAVLGWRLGFEEAR